MAPTKATRSVAPKGLTKTALAEAVASSTDLKRAQCSSVLTALAEVVSREVNRAGKVTIPGVAVLKVRTKPATKAGKREMFGKVVVVKAQPARKVVKAQPAAAVKKAI